MQGADKRNEPRSAWVGGELLKQGDDAGWIASVQGLGHSEGDAAFGVVILAAVATVGQVAGDGLAPRLPGRGWVARVGLDGGEDVPAFPRLCRVAELRFAFDGPADFLARFVETPELVQTNSKIAPIPALPGT